MVWGLCPFRPLPFDVLLHWWHPHNLQWTGNSRIEHGVADTITGPYKMVDVAIPTWSHNSAPVALEDGTCQSNVCRRSGERLTRGADSQHPRGCS